MQIPFWYKLVITSNYDQIFIILKIPMVDHEKGDENDTNIL